MNTFINTYNTEISNTKRGTNIFQHIAANYTKGSSDYVSLMAAAKVYLESPDATDNVVDFAEYIYKFLRGILDEVEERDNYPLDNQNSTKSRFLKHPLISLFLATPDIDSRG